MSLAFRLDKPAPLVPRQKKWYKRMWDCFHVRGLRVVTNNSFICCLLFYPSFHPIPSSCPPPQHLSLFPILSITTFANSTALLHQQAQPASQQWAAGHPSKQWPEACDTHPRLPGRPWLPNDDDPRATVALPQLTTGTCLLHTRTGRVQRLGFSEAARFSS